MYFLTHKYRQYECDLQMNRHFKILTIKLRNSYRKTSNHFVMSFNGTQLEQAYVFTLLISSVYGTIASAINIILIYNMNITGKVN